MYVIYCRLNTAKCSHTTGINKVRPFKGNLSNIQHGKEDRNSGRGKYADVLTSEGVGGNLKTNTETGKSGRGLEA